MYKVSSRSSFLIIALFMSINVVPVAGENTDGNSADNIQTVQENVENKEQATTSLSVKRILGKSLVLCALGYYAYYYGNRYVASYVTNKKLSDPFYKPFFSNYRVSDSFNDQIFWVTAKNILDNKNAVKTAFYNDLKIPQRIVINEIEYQLTQTESNSDQEKKKEQIDVYQKVIRALGAELREIQKSIEHLAPYANIFEVIKKFAFQNKSYIKLDDIYLVLSKYDENGIAGFATNLNVYSTPATFWQTFIKSLLYPQQDKFMEQCWEYIQRYVRVRALKTVIEEDYSEFCK